MGGQRKERQEYKLGSPGQSVKEKRFLVCVGGETAEQPPLYRAEFTGKRQVLGPRGKMARRPGSVSSLLTTHWQPYLGSWPLWASGISAVNREGWVDLTKVLSSLLFPKPCE